MISFDEASAHIATEAQPLGVERLPLNEAAGRILSESLRAAIDSPRCDVSAMDGFAVREGDLAELPARLRVVGDCYAGQSELPAVGRGECARIFTGGSVPPCADRVVVQEIVGRDGEWAIFDEKPGPARHIRKQGSDFRSGQILLPAGKKLDPRALVAAAAADVGEVEVWTRPRFTVLCTGDELAEPGKARNDPVAIPESLSIGIAALGEQWGGQCVGRGQLHDDLAQLEACARGALETSDLVVVTGGASVGEKDFAKAMFEPTGLELSFSKVAIKPGKPVWFGRAAGKLVLGLPGNPTSAMVTARLFLAPLINGLAGGNSSWPEHWRKAPIAAPLSANGDRETFLRACRQADTIEVLSNQDSGAQKALAQAELLVRRAAHAPPAQPGEYVEVLDF